MNPVRISTNTPSSCNFEDMASASSMSGRTSRAASSNVANNVPTTAVENMAEVSKRLKLGQIKFDQAILNKVIDEAKLTDFFAANPDIMISIKKDYHQDIQQILRDWEAGLENHSTICDALSEILATNKPNGEKLIPELQSCPERIVETLHRMWLMETLVCVTEVDVATHEKLISHFNKIRDDYGLDSSSMTNLIKAALPSLSELFSRSGFDKIANAFFAGAKAFTVGIAMKENVKIRKDAKNIPADGNGEKHFLTKEQLDERAINLSANVGEATATDMVKGSGINGESGGIVMKPWMRDVYVKDDKIKYGLSKSYTKRYHPWNLAFILINLPNMDLLLCKLLIRSVFTANGDDYMDPRARALSFGVEWFYYRLLDDKNSTDGTKKTFEMFDGQRQMGDILAKYALNSAKEYEQSPEYQRETQATNLPWYLKVLDSYIHLKRSAADWYDFVNNG